MKEQRLIDLPENQLRLTTIRKFYCDLSEHDRREFVSRLRINHGFEKAAWLMSEIENEAGR